MNKLYHDSIDPKRQAGLSDGERRRDEAFLTLIARREIYILRGRRALLEALLAGNGIATIDDVRARVELPPDIDPVLFGAVPGYLARAGIIAAEGFARVTRREAHARPVQRWRLVDRQAAVAWLATNTESTRTPGLFTSGEGK